MRTFSRISIGMVAISLFGCSFLDRESRDEDGDGFSPKEGDCNDLAATMSPDDVERCNGIDDDCDGAVDDDAEDMSEFFEDDDGDGFGNADESIDACEAPEGYVEDDEDCDDDDDQLAEDCDIDRDTDGDGLTDAEEAALGTDPEQADTDGDGEDDGIEHEAGTDPLDAESHAYTGGWPTNPDKDQIADPGWNGRAGADGAMLPRFAWLDQYGERVDIYDFAGQGKPMLLNLCELDMFWCAEVGKLLEGESTVFVDYYARYAELEGHVAAGDFYWVTVLDGNYANGTNDYSVIETWFERYPNPNVPVLWDEDRQLFEWIEAAGWPTMVLIEEDMTVGLASDNYADVWDELLDRY